MHLVIGTGQPRNLDFTIVSGQKTIPAGAQIYAIFSGEYAFEQLDEHLFAAMTDEEYYTFRGLARDARERESRGRPAATPTFAESLIDKLRAWLPGRRIVTRAE